MLEANKMLWCSDLVADFLDELQGRKGFDEWWYEIDDETQDEIENKLETIAREFLDEALN